MFDPDEHDYPEDRCLDDAWVCYDDLDNRFADARWPNPRILLQDREWITADGDHVPLTDFDAEDAQALTDALRSEAVPLHVQAAVDEHYTMSSALAWAYRELCIPLVKQEHPLIWLDAQPLMRALARRAQQPGGAS